MSFAEELLFLAKAIVAFDDAEPSQAALRRSVSTAYYALFHLLISEATRNWERPEHRSELGRVFDHGKMKNASIQKRAAVERGRKSDPVSASLFEVTNTFVNMQQRRNLADYSTAEHWDRTDALDYIAEVAAAFESWKSIREEPIAQAYLVSLLGARP
jgi:uncharacterized protein (UPF0332 family)